MEKSFYYPAKMVWKITWKSYLNILKNQLNIKNEKYIFNWDDGGWEINNW